MTTAAARRAGSAGRDALALSFIADMYGVQIDHLARLVDSSPRQARAIVTRWTARGLVTSAVLSSGPPWVWLTRAGLNACGAPYRQLPPALPRLPHLRAVTAARLALEAAPGYHDGQAHWRSERRLRARMGGRLGLRDHLPDAEVHWPDLPEGSAPGWAGECWAIEAELTPKTVARTIAIMRELLARTGDYGCPASEARRPGAPPRHARAIYLCSPAATPTVLRARAALGSLSARIEVRALPADAYLAAGASR